MHDRARRLPTSSGLALDEALDQRRGLGLQADEKHLEVPVHNFHLERGAGGESSAGTERRGGPSSTRTRDASAVIAALSAWHEQHEAADHPSLGVGDSDRGSVVELMVRVGCRAGPPMTA